MIIAVTRPALMMKIDKPTIVRILKLPSEWYVCLFMEFVFSLEQVRNA